MSQEILGVDVLIYTGNNELIGGQRDCSISISGDQIDTTTKDNGNWKTSATGLLSWSINLTLVEFAGQRGKSQTDFMKAMTNRENVVVKCVQKGKAVYSGEATISSKELSGSSGDVAQGTYTLNGASALNIDYVPFVRSVVVLGNEVAIKLTESNTELVDSVVINNAISVDGINPTSATLLNGVITCVMASAPAGGSSIIIEGNTLKSGVAVQTEILSGVLV